MLGSLLEKENKNKGQRSGFQADNVCGESYSSKNNNLSIIHLGHSVYNNTGEPAGDRESVDIYGQKGHDTTHL